MLHVGKNSALICSPQPLPRVFQRLLLGARHRLPGVDHRLDRRQKGDAEIGLLVRQAADGLLVQLDRVDLVGRQQLLDVVGGNPRIARKACQAVRYDLVFPLPEAASRSSPRRHHPRRWRLQPRMRRCPSKVRAKPWAAPKKKPQVTRAYRSGIPAECNRPTA